MLQKSTVNTDTFVDSYEAFMTKHLQHYGLCTGKDRFILSELEGYEKAHRYSPSDDSQSENQDNQSCVKMIDQIRIPKTTQLLYNIIDDGRIIPTLKAPHVLHHDFVINLKQAPRWPVEMQVIPDTITHIRTMPSQKEPLYVQSGSEPRPQPRGEDREDLVYEYNTFSEPFFIKSKFATPSGNTNIKSASITLESDSDDTLLFESRFESGNLEKVYKVGPYEYELHLRPDMYTTKHTQWYYFRVTNTRTNKSYKFTIVNLYKSDSLYNEGLKPLMYSDKDAQQSNKGWRRWGTDIVYYRNNKKYSTMKGDKYFYSLTWTCNLPHERDTIYFSHCYPYTYSDLMQYIETIKKDTLKSSFCHVKLLTYSLADNLSIIMTVTNPSRDSVLEKKKKIIVLTGRVHPGESNASWMMEGILEYLLDDTPDAKLLRDLFIFKIVPMINPDGVIVGNYRCSLAGRDLNRNYKTQLTSSYPIIASIRTMVDRILKEREILFYCDLHGHSRKHNIFVYGCNDHVDGKALLLERAFPVLLNRNIPDKFDYRSCKFKMQKSKAGTGRIVFRNLGISHSLTIEASFCGSTLGTRKKDNPVCPHHFNIDDFKAIGKAFCNSLLDFCDPDQKQVNEIVDKIREELTRTYISKLESDGVNVDDIKSSIMNLSQFDLSDGDSSDDDNGSDSSDSNGLPVHYEYMNRKLGNNKRIASDSKEKDVKENVTLKQQSHLGISCMTCNRLSKSSRNHKVNDHNHQTRTTTISSKSEIKNIDTRVNTAGIRKIQSMDMTKNTSPVDPIKRTYQELEATKIQLSYSGKSRHQADNNIDYACTCHDKEAPKEEGQPNYCVHSPENVPNHCCVLNPIKLKSNRRHKSEFLSKKIHDLRFSPQLDCENHTRLSGMFGQKPLNPIKRVQFFPLIGRQQPGSIDY